MYTNNVSFTSRILMSLMIRIISENWKGLLYLLSLFTILSYGYAKWFATKLGLIHFLFVCKYTLSKCNTIIQY